jgi:hypothetical protein
MPKKHLPGCWSLIPANTPEPPTEPDLLTEEELAEVNTLYEPLDALIWQFIETHETWPYDAVLEALARLTDFYEGMEAHVSAEIEKDIAAEEADA